MPEPELLSVFVQRLNRVQARYMIGGSVAAILYGEPRLTHDIDFVLFLRKTEIPKLVEAFPETDFYLPPVEVIETEIRRECRGHFNVLHVESGLKADFYPSGHDELHLWAMERARNMEFGSEPVVVAPPEYVIVRKLEYFREGGSTKHLRDIQSICELTRINTTNLELWIRKLGLEEEWKKAHE